jgi:hypothetical protein
MQIRRRKLLAAAGLVAVMGVGIPAADAGVAQLAPNRAPSEQGVPAQSLAPHLGTTGTTDQGPTGDVPVDPQRDQCTLNTAHRAPGAEATVVAGDGKTYDNWFFTNGAQAYTAPGAPAPDPQCISNGGIHPDPVGTAGSRAEATVSTGT